MTDLFPVYLSTVDVNHHQERVSRPNGCNVNQLFIVSKGNGILNINGESYSLSVNDCFYIEKNFPHEYYGTDEHFSTTFISFFGNCFDNIKKYYKLREYGVYINKFKGSFTALVENLYANIEQQELSLLCSETYSTIISFFEEVCKKEYKEIEAVHKYILTNYSKQLTLEDILLLYPHSKSTLCRAFKKEYGYTIFDFLTATRLKHAKYLIRNHPNLKLKEIAQSCGFNDASYFCKMYKKHYGNPPKSNNVKI